LAIDSGWLDSVPIGDAGLGRWGIVFIVLLTGLFAISVPLNALANRLGRALFQRPKRPPVPEADRAASP
jgi:hypothetical protein